MRKYHSAAVAKRRVLGRETERTGGQVSPEPTVYVSTRFVFSRRTMRQELQAALDFCPIEPKGRHQAQQKLSCHR
ncbi:hypothetical protein RB213_008083 [Colletotrichum asianum]